MERRFHPGKYVILSLEFINIQPFAYFSGEIFDLFLEREACKLARVPVVLAVHAPSDMCSSFRDACWPHRCDGLDGISSSNQ